jgi:hypothetical protein
VTLADAIRRKGGPMAARLAWFVERHGGGQELETALKAEREAWQKLRSLASGPGDRASLRALLLRQLFETKPTPLMALLGPYDPAETLESILRHEKEAQPQRPELLRTLELWMRTNESWIQAHPEKATLLGGIEKDSGPWPVGLLELIENVGPAGTLAEVIATTTNPTLKAAFEGLAPASRRHVTLRDAVEKEYGEVAGRLVEWVGWYGGTSPVRTAIANEDEFFSILDGIATQLPQGITLRSVIFSEFGRRPAVAELAPYVIRATLTPDADEIVSGYRLTAPLRFVLTQEVGDLFRDVRVTDGVPGWTDDYSDVLRVLDVKEIQKARRFFGLPTPVLGD